MIPLGGRSLRVVEVRDDDTDQVEERQAELTPDAPNSPEPIA